MAAFVLLSSSVTVALIHNFFVNIHKAIIHIFFVKSEISQSQNRIVGSSSFLPIKHRQATLSFEASLLSLARKHALHDGDAIFMTRGHSKLTSRPLPPILPHTRTRS